MNCSTRKLGSRGIAGCLALAAVTFCSCQSLAPQARTSQTPTAGIDAAQSSPQNPTIRRLSDEQEIAALTRVPNSQPTYRTVAHQEYNPPHGPIAPVPKSQARAGITSAGTHAVGLHGRHGAACSNCECCKNRGPCGPNGLPIFHFENEAPTGPFVPPGIGSPWPYDEYLWNGCDINDDVRVKQDYSVIGLDPQDTVIHYDTLDGETKVKPANCVPIYAPRFASVRKIVDPIGYEATDYIVEAAAPIHPTQQLDNRIVNTTVQPVQPISEAAARGPEAFIDRNRGIEIEERKLPYVARTGFLPFEDLLLIRRGEYVAGEKARLAARTEAALVWQSNEKVQVMFDGKLPFEATGEKAAEGVYVFKHGGSCVRICKIASKSEAQPGEIIDFTLRFDNVGDRKVGNVTIIDNLISRLEYVEGSQSCTLKANFIPTPNEGESLTLRWEIEEPLEPLQGGIIRFQCKLR